MLSKEEMQKMMNLKWLSNVRSGVTRCSADVSITRCKANTSADGTPKWRYSFIFRNNKHQLLGSKIDFAVLKNRLYIKPNAEKGNKVFVKSSNTQSGYAQIQETADTIVIKPFMGDYDELKYDEYTELYYIERSKDN